MRALERLEEFQRLEWMVLRDGAVTLYFRPQCSRRRRVALRVLTAPPSLNADREIFRAGNL